MINRADGAGPRKGGEGDGEAGSERLTKGRRKSEGAHLFNIDVAPAHLLYNPIYLIDEKSRGIRSR